MDLIVDVAFAAFALNLLFCGLRAARGPTPFDRVLALDAIALNVTGLMLLVSFRFGTALFLDYVLVVTLFAFLGSVLLATYLERRRDA